MKGTRELVRPPYVVVYPALRKLSRSRKFGTGRKTGADEQDARQIWIFGCYKAVRPRYFAALSGVNYFVEDRRSRTAGQAVELAGAAHPTRLPGYANGRADCTFVALS